MGRKRRLVVTITESWTFVFDDEGQPSAQAHTAGPDSSELIAALPPDTVEFGALMSTDNVALDSSEDVSALLGDTPVDGGGEDM